MEKEQLVKGAEKVKAFAMGLIGVCFASMGASYFEEQAVYRVPRILLPVYDTLGNVGLAVAMIILGLALIGYGYFKWKKYSQKGIIYLVLAAPALAIGIYLATSFGAFKDKDERMSPDERRNAQIEDIRNMDKPDFKNEKIEKFLAEFDGLLQNYKAKIQAKDEEGINAAIEAHGEWLSRSAEIMSELKTGDEKYELSAYMAQLGLKWHDAGSEE